MQMPDGFYAQQIFVTSDGPCSFLVSVYMQLFRREGALTPSLLGTTPMTRPRRTEFKTMRRGLGATG